MENSNKKKKVKNTEKIVAETMINNYGEWTNQGEGE
jgi:hypothetical protein